MHFLTKDFENQIQQLKQLKLSDYENKILKDFTTSIEIYTKSSHSKRIQLMKHNLISYIKNFTEGRSFYKYGSIHTTKAES